MQTIIAKCGIACHECDSYIATQNNDEEAIIKLAGDFAESFGKEIDFNDLWCEGCQTLTGRLSAYCRNVCDIRRCAFSRDKDTCAECEEYKCEILEKFFTQGESVPEFNSVITEAKSKLEDLRSEQA